MSSLRYFSSIIVPRIYNCNSLEFCSLKFLVLVRLSSNYYFEEYKNKICIFFMAKIPFFVLTNVRYLSRLINKIKFVNGSFFNINYFHVLTELNLFWLNAILFEKYFLGTSIINSIVLVLYILLHQSIIKNLFLNIYSNSIIKFGAFSYLIFIKFLVYTLYVKNQILNILSRFMHLEFLLFILSILKITNTNVHSSPPGGFVCPSSISHIYGKFIS